MWMGLASSRSRSGLDLKDNGVCVVVDNTVNFAVSEGRMSRRKHDSAAVKSLAAALKYHDADVDDIRRVCASSCTDEPWSRKALPSSLDESNTVDVRSHHYSHALSSYHLSPFDRSLVLVLDAGGNVFADMNDDKWWSYPRTQHSLWIGWDGELHRVDRPFSEPYDTGFGEWYRAFTHYLGWKSHTKSGNTMALSAYGAASQIYDEPLWNIARNSNSEVFNNDPKEPVKMVLDFLEYIGMENKSPRRKGEMVLPHHKNIAAYIQESLIQEAERYITDKIKIHRLDNLCLSGGVAQNCLMNSRLARVVGSNSIYVSPFSGDVGQCVGNAISAWSIDRNQAPLEQLNNTFLGPSYSQNEVEETVSGSRYNYEELDDQSIAKRAAQCLAGDDIVAIYRNRSEFGPRALGHRSVLGKPDNKRVISKIKSGIKQRPEFMPLAPVIHKSLAEELSDDLTLSKTMVFAPEIPEDYHNEFGYTTHVDGTSRLQIADDDILIHNILEEFSQIYGNRVLINTSFNARGEPIVETPSDAIKSFNNLKVDHLILNNMWLSK